ncbi:MAG: DNA polymerase III subunit delta [Oscillospiraceae bacterium]|nr:DNA polymerase III subunit delta [Oscillospiraceae bacterium]
MTLTEEQLIAELKNESGNVRQIYYLHGKEIFLVQTYAKKIAAKALGDGDPLLNYAKIVGVPDLSELADFVDALPVFAERRVLMLNDLNPENLDKDSLERLIEILQNISDTTCVIIYATGFVPDIKKAKTKKLLTLFQGKDSEKSKAKPTPKSNKSTDYAIIDFEKMSEAKIVSRIENRVNKLGCKISKDNAVHLARVCLRNYTMIFTELGKLCAYVDYKGEISRKMIDTLTERQLESAVFALAGEITSKRSANAFRLLDELLQQGNDPVVIISTLAMTFVDFYRAKLASSVNRRADQVVSDFNYPPNRSWTVGKAFAAVGRLPASKIRGCVEVLCDADHKLKSSRLSNRIIVERAIAQLIRLC